MFYLLNVPQLYANKMFHTSFPMDLTLQQLHLFRLILIRLQKDLLDGVEKPWLQRAFILFTQARYSSVH